LRLATEPDIEVVGEAADGGCAVELLRTLQPDLVFLDVQMPDLDGFAVLSSLNDTPLPAVVFVTAYDDFAVRAFEEAALDYLVKPVSEARFGATMKRLMRRLRSTAPSMREESIVVMTSRGAKVLPVSEVDWIEAAGNYVQVWAGSRSYFRRESLQQLEERVRRHGFIRAHRRALVRLDGVRELTRTRAGRQVAVLSSGVRIPISRRRNAAFMAALRLLGKSSPEN